MKSWLAIYTKSRSEKKVADRLSDAGIEVYCPTRTEMKFWSDRKKKIEVPIFSSYVFVKVSETERLQVLQTQGVVRFVFWLGQPAIIRETEIQSIRYFLENHPNAYAQSISIQKGQKVEVAHGQLKSQEGIITEVRDKTVVLRLESVGFELYAEIEKSHLKET